MIGENNLEGDGADSFDYISWPKGGESNYEDEKAATKVKMSFGGVGGSSFSGKVDFNCCINFTGLADWGSKEDKVSWLNAKFLELDASFDTNIWRQRTKEPFGWRIMMELKTQRSKDLFYSKFFALFKEAKIKQKCQVYLVVQITNKV